MRKLLVLIVLIQLTCSAAPHPAEQQAKQLHKILQQADDAYYNQHHSLMSDAAYDALRSQYDRLIKQYPELKTDLSVGIPPTEPANHVDHTSPILSLEKAYTPEAVESFLIKCGTNLLYGIEPKIDGLTVILSYKDGLLAQALTRGDGKTGIEITAAILASGVVPSELILAPARLTVRGEIFISHSAFKALNQRRVESGKPLLKSPRNTAAGTLRLKDYSEIANRKLSLQIFELIHSDLMPATQIEALALIESAGLPVIQSHAVTAAEVHATIANLNEQKQSHPFQTDGIVIKVNDRAVFEHLGTTAHHPRGALARKYKETPIKTRLLKVSWTRGKTGKITPIGHFEPVEIHGAMLQKATLHNLDYIRALDLKIGDCIQVIRAGGSIPEIIGNCPDRRTGRETTIPNPIQMDI
jgi:DNA ligase (NAD+)